MKALVFNATQEALEFKQMPEPEQGIETAVVQIKAAALNHRDLFITQGLYANIKTPCILGSDGAGLRGGGGGIAIPSARLG